MVNMNHKHVYNKVQVTWSNTWLVRGFDTTCACVSSSLLLLLYWGCVCDVICHGVIDFLCFPPPLKSRHGLCGCLTSGAIRHVCNSRETKR